MTQTNWKVETRKMNGQDTRVQYFSDYKKALNYYDEQCDAHNIDESDREYPGAETEVELSAGGRGYDHRIELLEDKN